MCDTIITDVEESKKNRNILLFPNPANRNFTVEIMNNEQPMKNLVVKIYNMNCELIYETGVSAAKTEISSENWTTGIYFAVIFLDEKIVAKEKVVLE